MKYDVFFHIICNNASNLTLAGFMHKEPVEKSKEQVQGDVNLLLAEIATKEIASMTLYPRYDLPIPLGRAVESVEGVESTTRCIVPSSILENSAIYCQLIEVP